MFKPRIIILHTINICTYKPTKQRRIVVRWLNIIVFSKLISAFLHRTMHAMRDGMWYRSARRTSKSCQRHFGTTSNTSALNQSIVGGRPDSVQVDSPLRQRARAYVTILWWAHKVPQMCVKAAYTRARTYTYVFMGTFWRIVHDQSTALSISPSPLAQAPSDQPSHRPSHHRHPKTLYISGRRIPLRNNNGFNGFRSGYDFYEA